MTNDDFVGFTTITRIGSKLNVTGIVKGVNGRKQYHVYCSKCNQDKEMYPNEFISTRPKLENGIAPCGCSPNPRYTNDQATIRVKRILSKGGYGFVGFEGGEYKNVKVKVIFKCYKHGNHSSTFSSIVSKGASCPECSSKRQRNPEANNLAVSKCYEHGYEFIGFEGGEYKNKNTGVVFECSEHGIYTMPFKRFVNRGCKCPSCSIRGFDKSKMGIFYIVKWTNTKKESWFKFGITGKENPEDRMKQQRCTHKRKMNEELHYDIRFMCHWDDGSIADSIEKEISNIQSKYGVFCTKEMMWDGHSETLSLEAVEDLQEAIKDNTWLDIDLMNRVYIHIPSNAL